MKNGARIAFLAVIILELFGLFAWSHIASDFTWLGLLVTITFIWGIIEAFRFSTFLFWMAFGGVVLDGVSALLEIYSRISPWDRYVHAWGGFVIAIAALELILRALKKGYLTAKRRDTLVVISIYLLVTGIGFLYEFWEYLVDKLQYGSPHSLVSAYNSIEDQLFNLAGATLVVLIYCLWQRRSIEQVSP